MLDRWGQKWTSDDTMGGRVALGATENKKGLTTMTSYNLQPMQRGYLEAGFVCKCAELFVLVAQSMTDHVKPTLGSGGNRATPNCDFNLSTPTEPGVVKHSRPPASSYTTASLGCIALAINQQLQALLKTVT